MKTEQELATISEKINSIIIENRLNYYEALGVLEIVKTYHQGALIAIHKDRHISMFRV